MKEEKIIPYLKECAAAYYAGEPIIKDAEFDTLRAQAKKLFPNNPYFKTVGAVVKNTPWEMKKHRIPMGSIENILVESPNTYVDDCLQNTKKWWVAQGTPEVLLQHKLDGLSVNLEYDAGMFCRAILRNDGEQGENIFFNAIQMKNVSRFLDENVLNIRAEIILLKRDLERINKLQVLDGEDIYSNARNAAAGIARRLDGKYSKYLQVIPFDVVIENMLQTDLERLKYLNQLFPVNTIESKLATTWEEIEEYYKGILQMRPSIPYGIDGVVIKVNNLEKRVDDSATPDWIRAMKFPPEAQSFKVDDIRWYVGKTGKVTPVLHNEAGVQFNDKVVNEVTLHNYNQFTLHKIGKGDKISVVIAGDVIPKIEGVIERAGGEIFQAPKRCPECDSILRVEEKFIFCDAEGCPGRVKALVNAHVKAMGIEEIGPELVDKLYKMGQAKVINFKHFPDLYKLTLNDLLKVEGYQKKSADKVLLNISLKTEVSLPIFIASLGISGVGDKIIEKIGAGTLDDLMKMTVSELQDIEGIGEIVAFKIKEGLDKNYHLIGELLANGVKILEVKKAKMLKNILQGKSYCFTGDVKVINPETQKTFTREECQALVLQYGGEVKSGVSKKLNVLVLADPKSQSGKARKARQEGVEMIGAEEFFKRVGVL